MALLRHTRGGGRRRLLSSVGAICVAASIAVGVASSAGAASGTFVVKSHLTKTAGTHRAAATGSLSGKLTLAGNDSSFTWTLKFSHLSGAALRAGIYFGKGANPSQLAMLLCNKCISGAVSYYHGSYVAGPAFVHAVLHGGAYVVIQTRKNPKGEISGLIKATAG